MQVERSSRPNAEAEIEKHREEIRKHRANEALERLYMTGQPDHAVPYESITELYDFVRMVIGDVPVTYLEFGVAGGRSMSRIAERFTDPGSRFFGFDSFEGLPEPWLRPWKGTMKAGAFSKAGQEPVAADSRVKFVKGWFQNSLPPFLKENASVFGGSVLVHYDADLYSSTLFVLSSLWNVIDSYYFIFDEFLAHEIIALYDFSQAFPVKIKFLSQSSVTNGYPGRIFGQISRIPFAPA
jgi:O-methyltransferase